MGLEQKIAIRTDLFPPFGAGPSMKRLVVATAATDDVSQLTLEGCRRNSTQKGCSDVLVPKPIFARTDLTAADGPRSAERTKRTPILYPHHVFWQYGHDEQHTLRLWQSP